MVVKPVFTYSSIREKAGLSFPLFTRVMTESTHLGNTAICEKTYNRKMGSFPDRNLPLSLPFPPMLKLMTTASRDVCHPIPVVRGGGFAGRAGWFNSWAAVLLVSF